MRHGISPHSTGGAEAVITYLTARAVSSRVGSRVEQLFRDPPPETLWGDTALVGATAARASAPVTMRGTTLSDLYSDIESWAASAVSSPSRTTPLERHP